MQIKALKSHSEIKWPLVFFGSEYWNWLDLGAEFQKVVGIKKRPAPKHGTEMLRTMVISRTIFPADIMMKNVKESYVSFHFYREHTGSLGSGELYSF